MAAERNEAPVDLVVLLTAKDLDSVAELRELLAMQVRMSRAEPGCLRFDGFESQTVPGTFIVVERWESPAALARHRQAEAITTIYVPRILPRVDRTLHVGAELAAA